MRYLWKHKKTKHLYRIMGFCLIEKGLVPAVIYARDDELAALENPPRFVRPCAEFFDGRFRQVDGTDDLTDEEIETMKKAMETQPEWRGDELDNSSIVPDCEVKRPVVTNVVNQQPGDRFGGAVNPESIAAKAERHFAAKKGGEAL